MRHLPSTACDPPNPRPSIDGRVAGSGRGSTFHSCGQRLPYLPFIRERRIDGRGIGERGAAAGADSGRWPRRKDGRGIGGGVGAGERERERTAGAERQNQIGVDAYSPHIRVVEISNNT